MKSIAPTLILLAAGLLAAGASQAGDGKLYRWTDAGGQVHYGDQPRGNAKEIEPRVVPPTAPVATPASARPDAAAAAKPDDCQAQKDKLSSYKLAAKISETNSLGETREYSAEERQKLIDVTQQAVDKACGPPS